MSVDVAIVGAGPAGSAAALELARAGRRVVLIERATFPRDKVCGGCLSGRAVHYLLRLLPNAELPGVATQRIYLHIGRHRLAARADGQTRVVLRSEFDAWLAQRAAEAGADVHFGRRATLVRGELGWDVSVDQRRLFARTVLAAGGLSSQSIIPATREPQNHITEERTVERRPAGRLIAQSWIQTRTPGDGLPDLGHVEMHCLRGGYVGLATATPTACLIGYVAEGPHRNAGKHEAPWSRLRRLNPRAALWQSLPADAPRQQHALGAAGFPSRPPQLGVDNVLLIGDAAGYVEPLTGEGMGQALCSAACAVRAVLNSGQMQRCYAELMRRHARFNRRLAILAALLRGDFVQRLAQWPLLPLQPLAAIVSWVHVRASE